jgi:uncharacterized protein (DUF2147 family)
MFRCLILLFFMRLISTASIVPDPNHLCGKWINTEKNLIVQIYREGDDFKAKILWFKNIDKSKPMDEWTDEHNPDRELRDRKLIGMSILTNMDYMPKSNSWENGKIYDAKNGREWDASARIDKNEELKVTGYWHFKFIGRTITFTRIRD